MSGVESAWVTALGTSVHYQVGGDGRPLVFLHGIGGGSGDWALNLPHFAARGFRAYAPDLPGHGRSGPPEPGWDPRDGGRSVLKLLDAWELDRAVLVGNSAGGLLALQAALAAPERVGALVLAAPAGLGRGLHLGLRLLTLSPLGEALWRSWPPLGRLALRALFADRSRIGPEMVAAWVERRRDPAQRRAFLRLLRQSVGLGGLRRDLVLADRLQELRCPVLLVWGREDRIVPPPPDLEARLAALPHVRSLELSACGHWPQVEQPDRFNAAVEEFLRG